jgi:hypothetical protein
MEPSDTIPVFDSRPKAEAWLDEQAASRGFDRYYFVLKLTQPKSCLLRKLAA